MLTFASLAARCAALARRALTRCPDPARRRIGRSAPTARGNVTLIFALAVIPIFGAVGVAVDYSRGNSARTAMQAALDATTLMIAKEALDLQNGRSSRRRRPISTRSSPAPT